MAHFVVTHFAKTLKKSVSFEVVIPDGCTEDIPVIYLLHGLSDDQTMWARRTSVEKYAERRGVAVVMPNGDRSFYTDMKYGWNYYTYISEELPEYVKSTFAPISHKREKTFICGNSMGGYGALKIALRNPDKYAAVCGMSSVADVEENFHYWEKDMECIFGSDYKTSFRGSENDLFAVTERAAGNELKPRVFQICGTEDFLYGCNVHFRDMIKDKGFDYRYFEEPGEHNWYMWDKWLPLAIDFFLEK